MSVRWLFIPISLLFFLPPFSIAGNGKITGRVVAPDNSGIRATIVLLEGERGVASDSAGHFTLFDVVPGVYDVKASAVGFHPKTVTGVHVSADETVDLFIQLVPGEITLPEVLVEEREPVIEKTRTSAKTTFDAEGGQGLPVLDVTALISTAPGVYGPFIRGAHQYDSRVYVDGVDVTDRSATWLAERIGYTNASFLENTMHAARAGTQAFLYPSPFAVEQATVYAGMAGADYGSAPGVITYALKEGRGAWHGSLQFRMSQLGGLRHAGPSVYNDASAYYAAKDAYARNSDPAIRKTAAYFTWTPEKYRYGDDPTYNFDFGMGGRIADWLGAYVGGGWSDVRGRLPNERTRQANATAKLTLPIATGLRVNLLGILQDRGRLFGWKNQAYDDTYRFFLEGVPRWDGLSTTASLKLSHFLSASMFYELQISYSHNNDRRGFCDDNGDGIVSPSEDGDYLTWEDPAQVRRYLGGPNSNYPALFFSTRDDGSTDYKTGANLTYRLARPVFLYEDYTHRTLNVRGTLNAQIHPQHQISLGGDIRRHWIKKLQRSTNQLMYASSPFFYEEWSRSPLEFSGFVQDRFESGGLIATMGIRLDAFNFNAANLRDYFAPIQVVTDATGQATLRPVRGSDVPVKVYVSPRLGVSHPVSDRAVLYFSLARTVSPLPYSILYYNYGSWQGSVTSVRPLIDQEPLIATSYDIGGQIRVHEDFTGSLGLFYRDMDNYSFTYMQPVVTRTYYLVSARAGFAATHGAEVTLDYRPERTGMTNALRARLVYTYSIFNLARTLYRNQWQYTPAQSSAIGTPGQLPFGNMQYWDRTYGRDYSGQSAMLSGFDRTHRFTLLLTMPLPHGFRLGWIGTFNSGFFYPELYDGNEYPATNTAYGYKESPWNKRVDLRLEKSIDLPGLGRLNFFADMINAFDWTNVLTYNSFNELTFKAWSLKSDPTGGPLVNQPVTMEGSLIYGVPREFYFGVNLTF